MPGKLLLQHEGDLEVDLVADDVAVLDHDVHVLNLSALDVAQGLVGAIEGLPYSRLEAVRGDGANLVDARHAHAFTSLLGERNASPPVKLGMIRPKVPCRSGCQPWR